MDLSSAGRILQFYPTLRQYQGWQYDQVILREAAADLGRAGGKSKSARKIAAARANGASRWKDRKPELRSPSRKKGGD